MARFDGKIALITGASSGIGRAAALAFAHDGARVVVSDVDRERGSQVVEEIISVGGGAIFVGCDVAREEDVQEMVRVTMDRFGRLDCAVNNAGIGGTQASISAYSAAEWQRVVDINMNGVFYCLKHEIPAMLQGGGGAIVNVSSILGTVTFPQAPAYVAAKHAVQGMTQAAAVDYATRGIRVNAVNPGFIETPMLSSAGIQGGSPLHDFIVSKHPIGRLGQPEEVAAAILWLCSAEASFVTGTSLLVDGGYTAV